MESSSSCSLHQEKLEAEEQANLLYIVCPAKHGEAMIDHHCAMIATLP